MTTTQPPEDPRPPISAAVRALDVTKLARAIETAIRGDLELEWIAAAVLEPLERRCARRHRDERQSAPGLVPTGNYVAQAVTCPTWHVYRTWLADEWDDLEDGAREASYRGLEDQHDRECPSARLVEREWRSL